MRGLELQRLRSRASTWKQIPLQNTPVVSEKASVGEGRECGEKLREIWPYSGEHNWAEMRTLG